VDGISYRNVKYALFMDVEKVTALKSASKRRGQSENVHRDGEKDR
jgi:hypothetical protein